ncbi:MAG TPA: hypothetical protein DCP69_07935 [Candidatus Omnitrophica bacterium]|nr:hypothetical protein [Candidatus Omnitrophota bacterium]
MQTDATEKGTIHYAQYEQSERLQRLLNFMLDGLPHSTMAIINGAGICAVNSAACELRKNGFRCDCIKKAGPAIYQLFDVEGARELSAQLLAKREVARG